jgi:hypothetical protein
VFKHKHKQILQAGTFLAVGVYFLNSARSPFTWRFLDGVDLIIHEAGHWVFMFFGEFLEIAGGSLFQVIVPLMFVVGFLLQQKYVSASFVLFWVGQSIINVSVYAGDAIAMQLPLLGGGQVIHDWNYLLTRLDLLEHTETVRLIFETIGVMTYLGAIAFGLYAVFYQKNTRTNTSINTVINTSIF